MDIRLPRVRHMRRLRIHGRAFPCMSGASAIADHSKYVDTDTAMMPALSRHVMRRARAPAWRDEDAGPSRV